MQALTTDVQKILVGNARQADMNVYFCGNSTAFPRQKALGPVVRDHFLFLYCHSGKGCVALDGSQHTLETGQCMITFPNQECTYTCRSKTPWNLVWVAIKGLLLPYYLQRMGISPRQPVFPWRNSEYILHCLQQIMDSAADACNTSIYETNMPASSTGGELERLSSVYSLLSESYRLCSDMAKLNSPDAEREDYIQKAIAYMEEHCGQKLKISDVAKHVGLNRSYLFTLFKEQMSESPQEFLTRLRIKKACDMFREPTATVASVAFSLGYEPRALTRLFKQITGATPTEYRKSLDK